MVLFPKLAGSFSPGFLYLSLKIVLVVISSFIYSIHLSVKKYKSLRVFSTGKI